MFRPNARSLGWQPALGGLVRVRVVLARVARAAAGVSSVWRPWHLFTRPVAGAYVRWYNPAQADSGGEACLIEWAAGIWEIFHAMAEP